MNKTAFHQQIAHQEQLHEKKALEFSREALDHYEVAYSLCDEILYDIEEDISRKSDCDRQAIFMILVRVMGTMQSIKWVSLKGYYYDGLVLFRSFMESLGTCCYISQNKGTGEKWLSNKKLAGTLDMFKALNKMINKDLSDDETARLFGKLCNFTHGDSPAIKNLISEIEDEKNCGGEELKTIRFSSPSVYDKEMVDVVAGHPLTTLLVIKALFPEISDYDKNLIEKQYSTLYEFWKKSHH